MCGLFGFLSHTGSARERLRDPQSILRSLVHRGPDASGVYIDDTVALAHTRLALVDLDHRSDQPIWDSSRRYCLIYNGELYGYEDLRDELRAGGFEFRTASDTEVLLAAFLRFGVDEALRRVEGMFAFGLYDRVAQSITLGRDRVGMKPLFVKSTPEYFAFASSVQALHAWTDLKPDLLSVQTFLGGYALPTVGRTFFDGVRIVVPGTVTTIVKSSKPTIVSFADWSDFDDPSDAEELRRLRPEAWVDRLDELLTSSIRSQVTADAPVGALCSGGIDSSLVAAIARRVKPDIELFHANVIGPQSEMEAARKTAEFLRCPLHTIDVDGDAFLRHFAEVTFHFGSPFLCQTNSPAFLLVSKLVHSHGHKAVVCGEGADENFLGYEWLMPNIRKSFQKWPSTAMRWSKSRWNALERKLRGKNRSSRPTNRDSMLVRSLPHAFERELCLDSTDTPLNSRMPFDSIDAIRSFTDSGHLAYILRTLFHRNDSLGMAAGIEARYPFMDRRLLHFAHNLPLSAKLRIEPKLVDWHHPFIRDKWVLRSLADRYLPKAISRRTKYAFCMPSYSKLQPTDEYFHDSPLAEWYDLSPSRLRFIVGQATPALKLRLLAVDVWGRLLIANQSIDQVQSGLTRSAKSLDKASKSVTFATGTNRRRAA
jgi:asparagine synthase (glutamine-hydrolysing)